VESTLLTTWIKNRGHAEGSKGLHALISIEVIEHLPSLEDSVHFAVSLLASFMPKIAIFTTPNYDANTCLQAVASGQLKPTTKTSSSSKGSDVSAAVDTTIFQLNGEVLWDPKSLDINSGFIDMSSHLSARDRGHYREEDHKFELTISEFLDWSKEVLRRLCDKGITYSVEHVDIGLFGDYSDDSGHIHQSLGGFEGGATQGIIFRHIRDGNGNGSADTYTYMYTSTHDQQYDNEASNLPSNRHKLFVSESSSVSESDSSEAPTTAASNGLELVWGH
jgi:hypothetical protein